MKWLEISVYTTDEGLDYVCAALDGAGITGQSIEESRTAAAAFLRESFTFEDLTVTILKRNNLRVLRLLVEQDPDWVDKDEVEDDLIDE